MSDTWNLLSDLSSDFEMSFHNTGWLDFEPNMQKFNGRGWVNLVWGGENFRRAHLNIVDTRDTHKLWMMHCTIFPHTDDCSPIFGFDIVAGKNKITGCFHDFSPTIDPKNHMINWFEDKSKTYSWNKTRELPDWGKRIFSPFIIAASNINDKKELNQIFDMAKENLSYYLKNVGQSRGMGIDTTDAQNRYSQNQKLNPHNPKVMASLGLNEEEINIFIQDCLFPEIR